MRSRLLRPALFVLCFVAAWCVLPGLAVWADKDASSAPHPALASAYRGSAQRALARTAAGGLTESDLYLFLLVSGMDSPLLFQEYEEASDPARRAELRQRVEKAIRAWAAARTLSDEAPPSRAADRLGRLRLRMLTYPVHQLVWIDRYLLPQVVVADADVRKYYGEHPDVSLSPPMARVRCIYLKVDPGAPRERWEARRREIMAIRDLAIARREDFAELARKHSQASSAAQGGEIPPFKAGAHFPAFEKQAFTLEPGEVSMPIRGQKGFCLLEGLRPPPQEAVSRRRAEPEIREILRVRQLGKRYEFALEKLTGPQTIRNRGGDIDLLAWDAWALKAGSLSLTKEDVWDLFPEFVGADFTMNKGLLVRKIRDMAEKELIAQFNEERGWTSHPVFDAGQRMALVVARASERLEALTAPDLRMAPEQVFDAVRANPSDFAPIASPRFSIVRARLLDDDSNPARRRQRTERLRAALEEARDRLSTASLQTLAADRNLRRANPWRLAPTAVVDAVCRHADPSLDVLLWTSDQPLDLLDAETRGVAVEVAEAMGLDVAGKPARSDADKAEIETDALAPVGGPPLDEPFWDEASSETAKRRALRETTLDALAQGERFLPVTEGENSCSLVCVERPDFRSQAVLDLVRFDLYAIAVDRARAQRIEKIRSDRLARARVEILVP